MDEIEDKDGVDVWVMLGVDVWTIVGWIVGSSNDWDVCIVDGKDEQLFGCCDVWYKLK